MESSPKTTLEKDIEILVSGEIDGKKLSRNMKMAIIYRSE